MTHYHEYALCLSINNKRTKREVNMILAIPIKNQYEQYCNAAALSEMGVITVNQVGPSFSNTVQNWIDDTPIV